MPTTSHLDAMLRMIHDVLRGSRPVPEFGREFYAFYLNVPDDALSDRDWAFFRAVHEKLDWTAEAPTEEDRRYGWITFAEYRGWLRDRLEERFNQPPST